MASSEVIPVGTLATVVAACPANPGGEIQGWFTGVVSGATVYFGGAAVTSTTGYSVATGGTLTGFLFPSDTLYAITSVGGGTVTVLQTGQ